MKLSSDQSEALNELLQDDEGVDALYEAIHQMLDKFEDDILDHPYTPGHELVLGYKKARLDGASKLVSEIKVLLRIK